MFHSRHVSSKTAATKVIIFVFFLAFSEADTVSVELVLVVLYDYYYFNACRICNQDV